MRDKRCTVIVNSCDAYEDLWTPFFTLLFQNWSPPYRLLLNTERKRCAYPDDRVETLGLYPSGVDVPWGKRLLDHLAAVETEFVLILMEDFFMTGPVDQAELDARLADMQADSDIAVFSFYPAPGDNTPDDRYPGYVVRAQNAPYRFNCQAAIWRTDRLRAFIQPDESAWGWEHNGNARSFALPDRFYAVAEDGPRPFPYDPFVHGVYAGQWLEAVPALFRDNGIAMDFNRRGFFDDKARAMHPQIGIDFKNDCVLYLDYGTGYTEDAAIVCPDPDDGERLSWVFGGLADKRFGRTVRLDPTTSGYCMYDSLCVRVRYVNGGEDSFTIRDFGTNGIRHGDSLVFFNSDPMVLFDLRKNCPVSEIAVEGVSRRRIPENVIDAVRGEKPRNPRYAVRHLLTRLG